MSFLAGVGHWFTTESNWTGPSGILELARAQIVLAALVILAAAVIGIGLGFFLGHTGHGGFLAVNSANAARAIPSLALLTLLVCWPVVGLRGGGFEAAFLALLALAIPPVLTNAYIGMREVDVDVKEAARAMGMSSLQRFVRVETPLAMPLAVSGLRTAAVEVVATSTLAAYVSYTDLGSFIFIGLNTNNTVESFCGAVLVAALAALTDLVLFGAYRVVTPSPLRPRPGSAAHRARFGGAPRVSSVSAAS